MLIFAVPASLQQHRYSPIVKNPPSGLKIDCIRVFIVAAILIAALAANITANLKFPALLDVIPVLGLAVWVVILAHRAPAQSRLEGDAGNLQGHDLPAGAGDGGLDDAGRKAAGRLMADRARARLRLRRVRQYPAHRAGAETRRLRLGLSRLCRRFRRIDDLVRLVRRRRAVEHVSGSEIGRTLDHARAGRSRSPMSSDFS